MTLSVCLSVSPLLLHLGSSKVPFFGLHNTVGSLLSVVASELVFVPLSISESRPMLDTQSIPLTPTYAIRPLSRDMHNATVLLVQSRAAPLSLPPSVSIFDPLYPQAQCDVWTAVPSLQGQGALSVSLQLQLNANCPNAPSSTLSSSGLSPAAIAGIVIACVIAGALVAVAVVLITRHKTHLLTRKMNEDLVAREADYQRF